MKKIIALILSGILLLGCFGSVSASSGVADITDTEEALALLSYMKMIDSSANISENITRAEFVSLAAAAIKAVPTSGKQYYLDVESSFWAFDAVSALTEFGYLSVNAEMKFRPNDNIMLSEAAKILVSMIGYGELAGAKGGFPAGYLEVAKRLDITEGISTQYITKEQAYVMLMRTMNVPMYTLSGISDGSTYYEVDNDSTILSVYHDIYYIEDVVNAAGPVSLVSSADISEGEALVGNKTLRTDSISQDMYEYLGMTIIGYYTETNSKKASLVVALPLGEENNVVTVTRDNVRTIEDKGGYYSFEYYDENDKIETAKVPKGAVVIKNGMNVTKDLFTEIAIAKGSYKFLDHDSDKDVDVLFVNEYYNLIVGLVENMEGMNFIKDDAANYLEYYRGPVGSRRVIYDKFDTAHKIDVTEDTDKIIKFKNADGSLATIDDIMVSDVLSVYKSKDGKYIEVIRGQGSVKGAVSEISSKGSDKKILTINEAEYVIENKTMDILEDKITLGCTGTFYLDAFGEIGFYVPDNADVTFGYLVAVENSQNAFEDDVYLQIYAQDIGVDIYKWSEKTKIDGNLIKDRAKAYTFFTSHAKEVIRFSANEEKVLTYVDTYKELETDGTLTEPSDGLEDDEPGNSLIQTLEYGRYSYASANGSSFSPLLAIRSTTPVMVVPTDDSIDEGDYDAESFSMTTRSSFTIDTSYDVASYRTVLDGGFEDLVLMKKDGAMKGITSGVPAIIIEIRSGLNDEGDAVDLVTLQYDTKARVRKTVDDKALDGYNLKKGDLVWFEYNDDNEIVSVLDVLVDSATMEYKVENLNNESGFYSKRQRTFANITDAEKKAGYKELPGHKGAVMVSDTSALRFAVYYGYAGVISNPVMRFAYTKDDCENGTYKFARSLTNANVIVYDRNSGKNGNVYWASALDIIDYKTDPENCSFVVAHMTNNALKTVYVYK